MSFIMDKIFKALADPIRRKILDELFKNNGQALGELCKHFDLSRQGVMKHLVVLESADLVVKVRSGRKSLHYINPVPILEISERWIGKYEQRHIQALRTLKKALEESNNEKNISENIMEKETIVYISYINTTPEKLWDALTNPEFTKQYWGGRIIQSDWKVGSTVKMGSSKGKLEIFGNVVESKPNELLSYTWHSNPKSTVTFLIEPYGSVIRLTVTHKGLDPDSKEYEQTRQGWFAIISSLKSLLETGKALIYPWKG